MRYFEVEAEVLSGAPEYYNVMQDGSPVGGRTSVNPRVEVEIIAGFYVHELDESGEIIDDVFYPVNTNTETFEDNREEVLAQIKRDYPAGEWQNHDW